MSEKNTSPKEVFSATLAGVCDALKLPNNLQSAAAYLANYGQHARDNYQHLLEIADGEVEPCADDVLIMQQILSAVTARKAARSTLEIDA